MGKHKQFKKDLDNWKETVIYNSKMLKRCKGDPEFAYLMVSYEDSVSSLESMRADLQEMQSVLDFRENDLPNAKERLSEEDYLNVESIVHQMRGIVIQCEDNITRAEFDLSKKEKVLAEKYGEDWREYTIKANNTDKVEIVIDYGKVYKSMRSNKQLEIVFLVSCVVVAIIATIFSIVKLSIWGLVFAALLGIGVFLTKKFIFPKMTESSILEATTGYDKLKNALNGFEDHKDK